MILASRNWKTRLATPSNVMVKLVEDRKKPRCSTLDCWYCLLGHDTVRSSRVQQYSSGLGHHIFWQMGSKFRGNHTVSISHAMQTRSTSDNRLSLLAEPYRRQARRMAQRSQLCSWPRKANTCPTHPECAHLLCFRSLPPDSSVRHAVLLKSNTQVQHLHMSVHLKHGFDLPKSGAPYRHATLIPFRQRPIQCSFETTFHLRMIQRILGMFLYSIRHTLRECLCNRLYTAINVQQDQ